MPNRVQTLRSSVPGNMPQASTRAPGELWVNFADAHLGYIDASQAPQKLLAVRLFVSTAPYATGDFVVYAGNLYQAVAPSAAGAFTAANWTKIGTAQDLTLYLRLAGGTMSGPLTLAADPTAPGHAATKNYVDIGDAAVTAVANTKLPLAGGTLTGALNGVTATFSGVAAAADPPAADSSSKLVTTAWFNSHQPVTKENSNRIINGDMRIDQRNGGASGTANGVYTVDRWLYGTPQASKGTWQRITAGPGAIISTLGFGYLLSFTSSSAYAALATDHFEFRQPIEADMIADFAWGTASAQPVTLSFLAQSSLSGTFSGSITNYAGTRSYPFTYSLTANIWAKITVTIPGDTTGAWVLQGNAGSLTVTFDLGSGANYRGPANAWASANYFGATGAVSVVGTNGATFTFTGVKLEIGSVATPYNRQSLAKSLADCQRYFQNIPYFYLNGYSGASGGIWETLAFPVSMRANPTFTPVAPSYNNASTLTTNNINVYAITFQAIITAAGPGSAVFSGTLAAEL